MVLSFTKMETEPRKDSINADLTDSNFQFTAKGLTWAVGMWGTPHHMLCGSAIHYFSKYLRKAHCVPHQGSQRTPKTGKFRFAGLPGPLPQPLPFSSWLQFPWWWSEPLSVAKGRSAILGGSGPHRWINLIERWRWASGEWGGGFRTGCYNHLWVLLNGGLRKNKNTHVRGSAVEQKRARESFCRVSYNARVSHSPPAITALSALRIPQVVQ